MPALSLSTALLLVGALPGVLGHTWIEQLRNIDAQGNYVGEFGYPRGMYSKTDPGYDGTKMNWQVPDTKEKSFPFISADSPLCHPSQRKPQQSSDKYPRLKTTPGHFIAMRYMENGHITKPATRMGKPDKSGPVYIYGTTQPKEDEKLAEILKWTADGQGGDKRGVLLTVNNYDDGRCYELNDFPISKERHAKFPNFAAGQVSDGPGNYPLFCESNVAIPKDTAVGKPYTLYWVWQWNTVPGVDPGLPKGQDEYYTTCIDVDVVEVLQQGAKAQLGLVQQDAASRAVDGFRSRTAAITDAMSFEMGPVFNSTPTATGSAPAVSKTQTTLVTTTGAPLPNSTASPSLQIPTLTKRPGNAPSAAPTAAPTDGDNVVRITVTERITVTAPAVTATGVAGQKRAEHFNRHGAKFRSKYRRE